MAMRTFDIYDPDDPYAEEWYERLFAYKQIARGLPEFPARVYAWRYEPDTWAMVFVTIGAVCGVDPRVPFWVVLAIGVSVGTYWPWAYFRKARVERLYEKLRRKRAILRVPRFLYNAVNAEAGKRPGLTDWDQWQSQRFALLGDILLEEGAMLRELWNDCGCESSCGHTNRLPTRTRKEMRRLLREKAVAKLDAIAAAHRGALEANRLRIEGVKGMLDQERGPQLPPASKPELPEDE